MRSAGAETPSTVARTGPPSERKSVTVTSGPNRIGTDRASGSRGSAARRFANSFRRSSAAAGIVLTDATSARMPLSTRSRIFSPFAPSTGTETVFVSAFDGSGSRRSAASSSRTRARRAFGSLAAARATVSRIRSTYRVRSGFAPGPETRACACPAFGVADESNVCRARICTMPSCSSQPGETTSASPRASLRKASAISLWRSFSTYSPSQSSTAFILFGPTVRKATIMSASSATSLESRALRWVNNATPTPTLRPSSTRSATAPTQAAASTSPCRIICGQKRAASSITCSSGRRRSPWRMYSRRQ